MRTIDADKLKQALVKLFPNKMPFDYDEDDNDLGAILCEVGEIIDNQPTVDRWITVEEGLPKDGETVLVITKCGHPIICHYDKYQKTWISNEWMVVFYTEEIRKWQPYSSD